MSRVKLVLGAKYTVYVFILLLLYVLQTTPGLFVLFDAKPMLVVPAAIAIAMYEGEFAGGIYGAFAGLLSDMGSSMLFGFGGLLLAFFCIATGLLVIHLMHCNVWNAILYVAVAMLIQGSLAFLFGFGMWGHANVWMIYVRQTLPLVGYTTVVTPVLFWLVGQVYWRAQRRLSRN